MGYTDFIARAGVGGIIPVEYSKEILKSAPDFSVVMKLGRRLRDMNASEKVLPVLDVLPEAYFVSERANSTPGGASFKQATKAGWDDKKLTAEEIACIVPIPEATLEDAARNGTDIWAEILPSIQEAIGGVFDAAALFDVGAPTSWPTGVVIDAIAKGNAVAQGSLGDLYDDIMGPGGVIAKVEEDGYLCNGHVGAIDLRGALRGVRDLDDHPIFTTGFQGKTEYALDGSPMAFPRNGAFDGSIARLLSGDFDQLVYSLRKDITWKVLTEGVISTNANPPVIQYNLAQEDMVAIRVVLRVAWQLPNPVNRINTNSATRYPFAVLTPASSGS